jgi:F0F1-type ATP synthase membrane subunit a
MRSKPSWSCPGLDRIPNVGRKWVNTWTPLILTFFFFILFANAVG